MYLRSSFQNQSLKSDYDALLADRQRLDHQIAHERRSPLPDRCKLDFLERDAARLRRELERYEGLFRTLARGRACRLRAASARSDHDRLPTLL